MKRRLQQMEQETMDIFAQPQKKEEGVEVGGAVAAAADAGGGAGAARNEEGAGAGAGAAATLAGGKGAFMMAGLRTDVANETDERSIYVGNVSWAHSFLCGREHAWARAEPARCEGGGPGRAIEEGVGCLTVAIEP